MVAMATHVAERRKEGPMNRKSKPSIAGPLVLAGGVALGYAGLRALLGLWPKADEGFFDWQGPAEKGVDVGSAIVNLPAMYYRDDSFAGFFSADAEAVRNQLPADDLHPVLWPGGRAVVAIVAFNYFDTSLVRYGEIGICPVCTYGHQAPPLLPLLLEARYPTFGAFVLHLPVTSLIARDGGRVLWGYAKFVSDMDFEKRPAYQRVRLAEGGAHILTLTVQQRGLPLKDNRPIITYSVHGDKVLRTVVPSRAVYQLGVLPGSGSVELGDHPVADQLRGLDLSPTAILTKNYLVRSGILPRGESVGKADRPHTGYRGEQRELGRLTVTYDDAIGPIDLYAGRGDRM
jgi:hypothetical protein